jgi:hypothetical protein
MAILDSRNIRFGLGILDFSVTISDIYNIQKPIYLKFRGFYYYHGTM